MGTDFVFCRALELDLEIGFHDIEFGRKQTVRVDLTLEGDFSVGPAQDSTAGLIDYYEVQRAVKAKIEGRKYKLIEALAVDIARIVIEAHPTVRARVRVTKHPLDMERVEAVGVECVRTAADFPHVDVAASLLQAGPPRASDEGALDLVILGAGPAGLAAATVARALGLRALLLESAEHPGGQLLMNPTPVNDCPGLNAQSGIAIASRLVTDLTRLGGSVRANTRVERVDLSSGEVILPGERLRPQFILLATGARRRTLGVPGESDARGRGRTPAAREHARDYQGRRVLVVGGGDVAFEEAVLFAEHCEHVLLIHRSQTFRARPEFRNAVAANKRIELRTGTTLEAIEGQPDVTGARLRGPSGTEHVEVAGVFIGVGLAPNSELVEGQVETDADGFLRIDVRQRTSSPRLYPAGDICSGSPLQVSAAIGQASLAVKDMERRICMGDLPR